MTDKLINSEEILDLVSDTKTFEPYGVPPAVESAGPPADAKPGEMWMMKGTGHTAILHIDGVTWVPITPQVNNAAAAFGNSNVEGMWVVGS